jgi:hypothetical protein
VARYPESPDAFASGLKGAKGELSAEDGLYDPFELLPAESDDDCRVVTPASSGGILSYDSLGVALLGIQPPTHPKISPQEGLFWLFCASGAVVAPVLDPTRLPD